MQVFTHPDPYPENGPALQIHRTAVRHNDQGPPSKEAGTMTTTSMLISDVAKEVQLADKGILSRTLFNEVRLKAVNSSEMVGRAGAWSPRVLTVNADC